MVGDPAGSREDIFVRCSIINSTSARPDFPAQSTAAFGPLPPFSISPRYQSTKRSIPCASDIFGRYPVNALIAEMSAYVAVTAHGCIGLITLIVGEPRVRSRQGNMFNKPTGLQTQMLTT